MLENKEKIVFIDSNFGKIKMKRKKKNELEIKCNNKKINNLFEIIENNKNDFTKLVFQISPDAEENKFREKPEIKFSLTSDILKNKTINIKCDLEIYSFDVCCAIKSIFYLLNNKEKVIADVLSLGKYKTLYNIRQEIRSEEIMNMLIK